MGHPLLPQLKARLKEMDAERNHLVALIALYEGVAPKEPPTARTAQPVETQVSFLSNGTNGNGPTDRIKAVLSSAKDGLTYGQVVEQAKVGMSTNATNPERSIGSTLQTLVKRGVVVRREGRHFLGATP